MFKMSGDIRAAGRVGAPRKTLTRLIAAATLAAATALGGGLVTTETAEAAPTYCKTIYLSGNWQGFAINPRMTVPVCYNGSSVWQSGNITPGVSTAGFTVSGFSWYGTYGGGGWLGAGENFTATTLNNSFTLSCSPRWGINAWGNQVSYSRNC